jgi:hypothetical protein
VGGEAAVIEEGGEAAVIEEGGEAAVIEEGEAAVIEKVGGEAAVIEEGGKAVVTENEGGEATVIDQEGEAAVAKVKEAERKREDLELEDIDDSDVPLSYLVRPAKIYNKRKQVNKRNTMQKRMKISQNKQGKSAAVAMKQKRKRLFCDFDTDVSLSEFDSDVPLSEFAKKKQQKKRPKRTDEINQEVQNDLGTVDAVATGSEALVGIQKSIETGNDEPLEEQLNNKTGNDEPLEEQLNNKTGNDEPLEEQLNILMPLTGQENSQVYEATASDCGQEHACDSSLSSAIYEAWNVAENNSNMIELNVNDIMYPVHQNTENHAAVPVLDSKDSDSDENQESSHESDVNISVLDEVYSSELSTDEEDNTTDQGESIPSWNQKFSQIPIKPFQGPQPGSTVKLAAGSMELDYFFQFFPEEIFQDMAHASNAYVPIYQAQRRRQSNSEEWTENNFSEITERDIRAYLGIRMIMAIDPKPSVGDYWSSHPALQNAYINSIMSRNRFCQIQRYVHINDPIKDPSRVPVRDRPPGMPVDPLYKVSPLLNHVQRKCKENYNLHKHIAIDEAMVKFHGQHSGVIGAPNKPAKRGFKIFVLGDGESGYLYDFEVYLKKQREEGLTQRVVEDLLEHSTGVNHILFVDKYYTSIPLAQSLLKKSIYICGSFNSGRRFWPQDLKTNKRLKKKDDKVRSLQRGEWMARQSQDKKMVATVWMDSALVYNLTTCYSVPRKETRSKSGDQTEIRRRVKDQNTGRWEAKMFDCPSSIVEYNKYMGAVDRHDHLRSSYSIQRTGRKWWQYFFSFAVDLALINSYLIYKETHPKTKHKKYQLQVRI